eukprot:gene21574-28334_t
MFFSNAVPASCSYAIMATIVALVVLGRVPTAANAAAVAERGDGTDAGSGTGADAFPVLPVFDGDGPVPSWVASLVLGLSAGMVLSALSHCLLGRCLFASAAPKLL